MADLRIPSSLPPAATPTPARTSEAVRAAQRAFFDTALTNASAPSVARPAAAAPAAAAQAKPAVTVSTEGQAPPARPLRPGSLLDIRI